MFGKRLLPKKVFPPIKLRSVFVICRELDWSTGATERVGELAPKINEFVQKARSLGIQIIHAPSETLKFYAESLARKRMIIADQKEYKKLLKWFRSFPFPRIKLPIDHSGGGSDTPKVDKFRPNTLVWTRQIERLKLMKKKMGFRIVGLKYILS